MIPLTVDELNRLVRRRDPLALEASRVELYLRDDLNIRRILENLTS